MLDRRTYLQSAALTLAAPAGVGHLAAMADRRWTAVEAPTSRTLEAAVQTPVGAFAAGSNGILLERTSDGWTVRRRNGPSGNGNDLHAVDVDDDGTQVWMAGASGALGAYDVYAAELTDHTAPDDVTDTLTALSVTGSGDEATVYLGDASGNVHVSRDGGASWTHLTPGSGATIHGLDSDDETHAALVDGTGSVFETTGDEWERAGLDAESHLEAVAVEDEVTVIGSKVHERSDDGWRSVDVTDAALTDVAICACGGVHAVGVDGDVVHRPGEKQDEPGAWRVSSPTEATLHGVTVGHPHVAVGASGTILER